MCRVLQLHPSGYYAWRARPQSQRATDDLRLLGLLKQAWLESDGVYGYRKLTLDMGDLGETCSRHRVAKLLRSERREAMAGAHVYEQVHQQSWLPTCYRSSSA